LLDRIESLSAPTPSPRRDLGSWSDLEGRICWGEPVARSENAGSEKVKRVLESAARRPGRIRERRRTGSGSGVLAFSTRVDRSQVRPRGETRRPTVSPERQGRGRWGGGDGPPVGKHGRRRGSSFRGLWKSCAVVVYAGKRAGSLKKMGEGSREAVDNVGRWAAQEAARRGWVEVRPG